MIYRSRFITIRILFFWLVFCIAVTARAAAYDFLWQADDQGRVSDLSLLNTFPTQVTNLGDVTDTFIVVITKNMPAGWTASLCQGSTCYSQFVTQISFDLAPEQETNVDVDMTPLTTQGSGSVTLTVSSAGDAGLSRTMRFFVVTPGPEVLLVAGDDPAIYASYYENTLDAAGLTHALWPRLEAGVLGNQDLEPFPKVVWFTGLHAPGLESTDRSALAYYVQHGGALLLSGQDLAYESCDPGSPYYSAYDASWFRAILGLDYAGNGQSFATASGPAADPYTGGLSLPLQGGDGAGDNTSCDVITPAGGVENLNYETGQTASIRAKGHYGSGQSFYLAFGLEGVATESDRSALMQAFVDWADAPSAVTGSHLGIPDRFLTAAPNPFNPVTVLEFTLSSSEAGPVTLAVHDLRGRLVRNLVTSRLQPGNHAATWDGRDMAGRPVPSGLYLARLRTAHRTTTTKLLLAK